MYKRSVYKKAINWKNNLYYLIKLFSSSVTLWSNRSFIFSSQKKQIPIHKSSAQKLMFTVTSISPIRDNKVQSIVTTNVSKQYNPQKPM